MGAGRHDLYAGAVSHLPRPTWLRRSDTGELLEWFLVAGVVSLLGIRAFLALTGYPRVGGGTLHIAHMLWGGALMLAALLVLFLYLDRPAHRIAAVIAGLGFGTFVDEIGKFVTADNDYFFRPALVLIYLIFVALFLLYRAVADARTLSAAEHLANALDVLEPAAAHPIDARTRGTASRLLAGSDPTDPLVPALRDWLASRPHARTGEGSLDRLAAAGEHLYETAVSNPLFERALVAIVLVDAVGAVVTTVTLVLTAGAATSSEPGTVSAIGQAASALVGAVLVARGVVELPRSRVAAYRWFRRGVLVWILVTQVFVFYISQLAGIAGLAVNVVAYAVLTYMIGQETGRAGGVTLPPGGEAGAGPSRTA